jgi:phospholipase C
LPQYTFRFIIIVLVIAAIIGCCGCAGAGASGTQPSSSPPLPTVFVSATPTVIDSNTFSTLKWATSNATVLSMQPPPAGDDDLPPAWPLTGSINISPKATTTYVLTATGPSGTATASVTVTVHLVPPKLTVKASPDSVLPGQPTQLTWSAEGATTVAADNGIGALAGTSGSLSLSPAATTTYTLTATGYGGTTQASVTVHVAGSGELAASITANPLSVAAGQSTVLTWSSQNATGLTIDQGVGSVPLMGSRRVTPSATTTYTLTAQDIQGNSTSAAITVSLVEGGVAAIKHIIVFVQENRSFDHYFGQLGAYRVAHGLSNDIDGPPPDIALLDAQGHAVSRYHVRSVCMENLTPDWNETHIAVNGGRMDSFMKFPFLPSTIDPLYHRAMGYYDERDIPYYYDLATQFATSDRFFAPVQGGTIPNRMYLMAATSAGYIVYPDYPPVGSVGSKTIFDALDEAHIDWRYYYQDNSIWLAFYQTWNKPTTKARMRSIDALFATLASPTADTDLPPVVYIEHGAQIGTDEHPGGPKPGIQKGAAVVKSVADALMASTAWKSSVMIVSHDEHGGFYDHVPPVPMTKPDDIAPRYVHDSDFHADFDHSGVRIPLLVISPWVKAHYVSHIPRDFTSILKFIETRFALPSLTRRDAAADDMMEMFDFSSPHWLTPPTLSPQPTDGVCDWQLEKSPT